jgi:Ca2+-binding RTX toxin-like protein
MPRIRIEWVPVQTFGLGRLGFDHLQLVYQQSDADTAPNQDAWFVMEGVREAEPTGAFLGIEGADGRTTLAAANLAARENLVAKIGTPDYRGSRALPYGGDEFRAWETMASYARDIEMQDFPYIAYALPGSPAPTINSSSAIASLIYYSGLDPTQHLPNGMHLSPGMATRLGTSGDDAMRIEHGFTTLLGGSGRDEFVGGPGRHLTGKLYGGTGDDLFHWSAGFNIVHGGQPNVGYAADGVDVLDYSGAGVVTITANRHWVPHKTPNYVAVSSAGRDHLYSIERIQWNETTDRIVLGDGVDLVEDDVILEGRQARGLDGGDVPPTRGARLIGGGHATTNLLLGDDGSTILHGSAGDDTLYGAPGNDTLQGGAGSDGYVYLPGDGCDVIVEAGSATDVDTLILAGGIAPVHVSLHRPAQAPGDLALAIDGGGSILIKDFFEGPESAVERIVFDAAPAWDGDALRALAAAAPVDDALPPDALMVERPDATPLDLWLGADTHWLF